MTKITTDADPVEIVGYLVRDRMYDNCFAYFDTWSEAANHADGGENAGANFIGGYAPEALMTVAQHERIVADLEADAQEARALLRDARNEVAGFSGLTSIAGHEPIDAVVKRIDAFLAQTAEGV